MIAKFRAALKIKNCLIQQQDQLDCGPAALLSVINYYDGAVSIEQIRQMSGTNLNGTTLLGLYKTSKSLGLDAEGCKANIEFLIGLIRPCILHVNLPQGQHYLVFFTTRKTSNGIMFVIGDPATGIRYMTAFELSEIWESKVCLLLTPGAGFQTNRESFRQKRKWLFKLLTNDKDIIGISIGLGIVVAFLGLVLSIFSQRLIDEILPNRDIQMLTISIVLGFVLLVIRELLSALRQYFIVCLSKEFSIQFR